MKKDKAIFIDRDGTVCEEMGYINHISRFRIFPWTAEAIRKVNESGFKAILITNQAGVARGFFPESFVCETHEILKEHLRKEGAHFDGVYYCPHHPEGNPPYRENCRCRKPKTGMIEQAVKEHGLDLPQCCLIGDQSIDLQLAQNVGIQSILVKTGFGLGEFENRLSKNDDLKPIVISENLLEAVTRFLSVNSES
ncbi:MAG: HAD family hydrolase [Deltaproteobacteria bacterium]|nr:HAD family hydrolase [Deltaproteobacteria bacterium]